MFRMSLNCSTQLLLILVRKGIKELKSGKVLFICLCSRKARWRGFVKTDGGVLSRHDSQWRCQVEEGLRWQTSNVNGQSDVNGQSEKSCPDCGSNVFHNTSNSYLTFSGFSDLIDHIPNILPSLERIKLLRGILLFTNCIKCTLWKARWEMHRGI